MPPVTEPTPHADATRPDGDTVSPIRRLRLEALARRAAAHQGATRALLDARLATLRAEPAPAVPQPAAPRQTTAPSPHPLRALVAALTPATAPIPLAQDTPATTLVDWPASSAHPPELRAVRQHRATWSRLRAEQRVLQTQTTLPDQAGPLNSQRLLHRALTTMRETAPGYLQHFMGQVEALLWMEQAAQASAPAEAPKTATRGKAGKPPPRGRAGKSPARAR